ncbi:MAG: hypothetical protein IJ104_09090, partial [Methanobrevibacter sp.]|nr:hypothetical protein [Methanobrevibacter sp.]
EIPATSGNWVSFRASEGIVLKNLTDLEFIENTINLNATDVITQYGYDTIYVVDVESDTAVIDGNIITANGKDYIYGIISTGEAFISNNEITLNSELNYACGIDIEFGSSGAVDSNVIYLSSPYVAYGIYASMDVYNGEYSDEIEYTNNDITIGSNAAYAMNVYGSEALIDGNKILMTGNYTMGISAMMMDDIVTITNNDIDVQGIEKDTKDIGDMIPAQTVGILVMSESQIHNNAITSTGEYTIINTDEYSEITDNYLVSAELLGDDSVSDTSDEALVENNIPIANATNYNLTNETFFLFFNENGFLRENITSESLTFIDEFSNLTPLIVIDKPINLLSDNATLNDMSFYIISDNVTVDGFTIVIETLTEAIHVEDASNTSIINNNIYVDTVEEEEGNKVISVIMSDDVLIDNNNIVFNVETNETFQNIAIHAAASDNLIISGNNVSASLPSRTIDWGSGVVYSQAVFLDDCDNAVLDGNEITVDSNGYLGGYDTLYAVNIIGDNATVSDNIIAVSDAPYGYGIVITGEDFEIDGNAIIADNDRYSCAIDVESNSNGNITDNIIAVNGTSAYGIYTANWAGDVKTNITDNVIAAEGNTVFGMSLSGSEALVENNAIEMNGNYTTGIASKIDNVTVNNNTILANASNNGTPLGYDSMGIETTGVHIVSGEATVTNNNITSTGEFAVDAKGTGSVTDNYLVAAEYTGDAAVDLIVGDTLVANNTPAMQRVIIQAEDIVMYYKNGTRYELKLTDMNGKPLANENVTLTINGATYSRTTDENGTASIAINLNVGNYTGSVSYVGTGNCSNSTIENSITVLSTIIADDLVKMFRNASQFRATFLDGQGNPLANGTEVTFNINGVMYVRTTDENGTAQLNINLNQGEYIITSTNPFNGQEYANLVTVLSNIVNNTDLVKYYRNGSQYVVTVVGADGNVVGAGENVTFNINGVMYTRTTNESGQAQLNINLDAGNYTITAIYGQCMVSNNIEVLPILYAKDLVKKYGTSDQFRVLLVDGQGSPFPGQNITFNINGVFYQRTTDADGFAALNIRLGAAVDEYIITSSYNGTAIANKIIIVP